MQMITVAELIIAAQQAESLLVELQQLYGQLPETACQCRQPGVCCIFIPQVTLLEALQWVRVIQEMPPAQKREILSRFIRFYLTNPVRQSGCPFLEERTCTNYRFRAFACRAYGLWSRPMGDDRTQKNRLEQKILLDMWREIGLKLPQETVEYEIDYCNEVECLSDTAITDNQLLAILERVYRMDQHFSELQEKFEGTYHSDFSFLIACLILGFRKAVLGKFWIIKEIINQSCTRRLENLLDNVNWEIF
jgi:Fe-S-cluster containining protein